MLHLAGHGSEATAPTLARGSAWRRWLLALVEIAFMSALLTSLASAAAESENYQIVDNLAVYLGVLPAAMVRNHPKEHPEAGMHGGVPAGTHEYHIVVAIFDAHSGARIENAGVTATVSGLADVGTKTIALQPMTIAGTITYGNFVTLLGTDRYDIRLQISIPGRKHPVQLGFAYEQTR